MNDNAFTCHLAALGAPPWYVQQLQEIRRRDGGVSILEAIEPLVIQNGYLEATNKRFVNLARKLERERKAAQAHVDKLTKEKLGWESTNHCRNEYISGLKKDLADVQRQNMVLRCVTHNSETLGRMTANAVQDKNARLAQEAQIKNLERQLDQERAAHKLTKASRESDRQEWLSTAADQDSKDRAAIEKLAARVRELYAENKALTLQVALAKGERDTAEQQAKEWKAKYQMRKFVDFGATYGVDGARARELLSIDLGDGAPQDYSVMAQYYVWPKVAPGLVPEPSPKVNTSRMSSSNPPAQKIPDTFQQQLQDLQRDLARDIRLIACGNEIKALRKQVAEQRALSESVPELRRLVEQQIQKIKDLTYENSQLRMSRPSRTSCAQPNEAAVPGYQHPEDKCLNRIIQALHAGAVLTTEGGRCHVVKDVWAIGQQVYALSEATFSKNNIVWQQEGAHLVPVKEPVPLPSDYTPAADKDTWALGDRVQVTGPLYGEVSCIEYRDKGRTVAAVRVTVMYKDIKRFYWFVRRRVDGPLDLSMTRYSETSV